MKKRVAVVYHHLPHYRYAVFSELDQNPDIDFTFIASSTSRDGSIPTLGPEHVKIFGEVENLWLGPFLWQRGLNTLLRKKWDAVIFLGDYSFLSTWAAAAHLRLRNVPVAFWTIGWHRHDKHIHQAARKMFYRLADRLLLYGNVGLQIGSDSGYPTERMGVIYNSSGGPHENEATWMPPAPTLHPPVVGAVIRLNPVKRLDLLIEAAAILKSRGMPVRVKIVGEGPERPRLTESAKRLGVELELPGAAYSESELQRFYSGACAVVVPSVAGLSVTQSLRHGRPVITHDNMHVQAPECEAIIDGKTGSLYEYENVDDLARAIEYWIAEQRENSSLVAEACHAEVGRRWSGQRHAEAITRELFRMWSTPPGSSKGPFASSDGAHGES